MNRRWLAAIALAALLAGPAAMPSAAAAPAGEGASYRPAYAPEVESCLPRRLHPVSRLLLEHWMAGRLSTFYFRRWFHLPNSDYLRVSHCVVSAVDLRSR